MTHRFIRPQQITPSKQACPLCGDDLVLEYDHDGSSLWSSSWCCARKVSYLGGLQGEYSIVLIRGESRGKIYDEESEYYYTDVCEVHVDVSGKTTGVYIQAKQFSNFQRILCLDEIKSYLKRIPKLATFI